MRHRAATAFVTGATLLFVAACGGSESQPAPQAAEPSAALPSVSSDDLVVASANDIAELTVPPGALPADVSPSDLQVTALAVAELRETSGAAPNGDSQLVTVIRLEPSGLRFLAPVILTLRLPRDLVDGPLVAYHLSDDGVEPLELELTSDFDSPIIAAAATVGHFSEVVVKGVGIDVAELLDASAVVSRTEIPVGESFEATVTIERLQQERLVQVSGYRLSETDIDVAGAFIGRVGIEALKGAADSISDVADTRARAPYVVTTLPGRWRISGPALIVEHEGYPRRSDEAVLDPQKVQLPDDIAPSGDTFTTGPHVFTCREVGTWTLNFRGAVQMGLSAIPFDPPELEVPLPSVAEGRHTLDFTTWPDAIPLVSGRCIAPVASGTATETPPPTSTPGSGDGTEVTVGPGGQLIPSPPVPPATSSVSVEGNGVTMTVAVPTEVVPGQTQVQVSIKGPDGQPLTGTVSCSLFRRGDQDGTHLEDVVLSSDGTATLTLSVPWQSGDEIGLFCFFRELDDFAQFITSFFLK